MASLQSLCIDSIENSKNNTQEVLKEVHHIFPIRHPVLIITSFGTDQGVLKQLQVTYTGVYFVGKEEIKEINSASEEIKIFLADVKEGCVSLLNPHTDELIYLKHRHLVDETTLDCVKTGLDIITRLKL